MEYKHNSNKIKKGDTFICLPGGEKYINDATSRGAVNIMKMNRTEMASFSNKIYKKPSEKMVIIGVTGTNGKTTVTHLVGQALKSAGYKPYVLGTINSELTTPESIDIQRIMAEHHKNGGTHFVMEVSSHAIDQGRILGIDFNIKLLTNITQDHLDYHKTITNYKETKLGFMAEGNNSIYPEDYQREQVTFKTKLEGNFNFHNIQSAIAILKKCNLKEDEIIDALKKAVPPPGRFENINEGQAFNVIVDYAHTPDGLENILSTAKEITEKNNGKMITVFGCGGNRDRGKRPKMARISTKYSDYTIITQDNPRDENPTQIISDIKKGLHVDESKYKIIENRADAISTAIKYANKNDTVIIAGKGHETYQILKTETIHFDDREQAREAIKRKLNENIN
jgi:UDP-N-acetylmuramoyl-L-alanyl-D-glutamate--2,6-diaminopimelate ligase